MIPLVALPFSVNLIKMIKSNNLSNDIRFYITTTINKTIKTNKLTGEMKKTSIDATLNLKKFS